MTTETMNIHKALAEQKLIDDKINKIIDSTDFVSYHTAGNDKVKGIPIDKFNQEVRSRLDSLTDMFARRDALHRGVQQSNAITKVTISGEEYTVAEAIWMYQYGMKTLIKLNNTISCQYNNVVSKVDAQNQSLERDADIFIQNVYNNKESKTDSNNIANTRKDYIEARKMELVDPIDAMKVIGEMTDKVQSFLAEVNTVLSTSNATTEITIQY